MLSLARNASLSRIGNTLRLSASVNSQHDRWSHGGPAAKAAGPVYELRVYSIRPDKFALFRKLMADAFHLRLAYSMPLGYWVADLGGVFQSVHIWPYESVSHRGQIRAAMATDQQWQDDFLNPFLTCAMKMDNNLMILAPGSGLCTDFTPSPKAAYELWSGPVSECGESEAAASPDETLVGRFHTVYGETNTEYRLLRYPDADTAFTHARDRQGKTKQAVGYSRFMVPHDISPIK